MHTQTPLVAIYAREGTLDNEVEVLAGVRAAGYEVVVCREQEQSRALIEADDDPPIHLIVTHETAYGDETDYADFVTFMKQYFAWRKTRVLWFTMVEPHPREQKCFMSAGDLIGLYMRKPIDIKELLSFLRRLEERNIPRLEARTREP